MKNQEIHRHNQCRSGTTLIEVLVSSVLVGVVLYTSMAASGTIHSTSHGLDQKIRVEAEALRLLEELRGLNYEDPELADGAERILGRETGEAPTDRLNWDDVDDATAYNVATLKQRDGSSLASGLTCSCAVDIVWVEPQTLAIVPSESGLKRVAITIRDGNGIEATVVGYFSRSTPTVSEWSAGYEVFFEHVDGSTERAFASPRNKLEGPETVSI